MFLFETNPEVLLNNVEFTFVFILIRLPGIILGTAIGLFSVYALYKFILNTVLLNWCKAFIPMEMMVHLLLMFRFIKELISVLSRLGKMI